MLQIETPMPHAVNVSLAGCIVTSDLRTVPPRAVALVRMTSGVDLAVKEGPTLAQKTREKWGTLNFNGRGQECPRHTKQLLHIPAADFHCWLCCA